MKFLLQIVKSLPFYLGNLTLHPLPLLSTDKMFDIEQLFIYYKTLGNNN